MKNAAPAKGAGPTAEMKLAASPQRLTLNDVHRRTTTETKPAPPPVEKIKVKVDGKEVEVPKTMPDLVRASRCRPR